MLKLHDEDLSGALLDGQFDTAELLYEDRKEGELAKRLSSYIRGLKRVTIKEALKNASENKRLLNELANLAQDLAHHIRR